MYRKWSGCILVLFLLFSDTFYAQINDDLGVWFAYNLKSNIKEDFSLSVDIQSRYNKNKQQLIRGVFGNNLNKNFNVGLGYGFFNNQRQNLVEDITENRIFQELNYKHTLFEILNFKHRFRIEERFMSHKDLFMRYRYALSLNYNLITNNSGDKKLKLLVANEIFINSSVSKLDENELVSYDRNRLLLGLEYAFLKKIAIQFAFMEQYLESDSISQLVFKVVHKI